MSNEPVYPSVKQGVLLVLIAFALLWVAGCVLSISAVLTTAFVPPRFCP